MIQENMITIYLFMYLQFVSIFAIISMYMPRIWFLAHLLGFLYVLFTNFRLAFFVSAFFVLDFY